MMNLTDYANYLYSAYHSNPSGSYARTPEEKEKLDTLSREDFVADMVKTNRERWQPGGDLAEKSLFAGSASRAKLSDTEIAVLANRYDLRNMDQKSYDNFLDDLAGMGAISEREKGFLGYGGLITAGYFDANGNMVMNGIGSSTGSAEDLWNSKADLAKWLTERVKWQAMSPTYEDPKQTASSQLAAKREDEMFTSLSGIVNRMLAVRGDSGEGADGEEIDIIDQIRDPNSDFYRDMYNRMRVKLEESEEEKKKQAIIDALDAVLESLSAKKDDWKKKPDSVSSMAELSQVIDSLDKDDPRKEELNLLRERLQNLGIYFDLDVGVKGKDQSTWGTTLTQQLIREEAKDTEPSIFDII